MSLGGGWLLEVSVQHAEDPEGPPGPGGDRKSYTGQWNTGPDMGESRGHRLQRTLNPVPALPGAQAGPGPPQQTLVTETSRDPENGDRSRHYIL